MFNDTNEREFVPEVVSDDETILTDISLEDEEETSKAKIHSIKKKLQACETEKLQHLEALQRAKADFLNSKRRLEEQKEREVERATIRHAENLLPLADSFEMAMKDPKWLEAEETWRKGVEGIHAQLMNVLRSLDVTPIDAENKPFDPQEHEALQGDGDVVSFVFQKGYKLKNQVIRPAKVSVASHISN